jgi:hypothetical protein
MSVVRIFKLKLMTESIDEPRLEDLIKATAEISRKLKEPFPVISVPVIFNKRISAFWSFGILFRRNAFWIGVHFDERNKRYCINPIPFVTIWICHPGGITP